MRRHATRWVDSESVRLYQGIIFIGYAIAGIQSLAMGSPPTAVGQAMGHVVALMWTGLLIACPVLSGLGYLARKRPGGLWLLVAGDAGAACATAAYVVAVLQATWAERASFAAWNAASLTACAVLILARDLRRLRQFERAVKEVSRE
jgi:hypothetical protein